MPDPEGDSRPRPRWFEWLYGLGALYLGVGYLFGADGWSDYLAGGIGLALGGPATAVAVRRELRARRE